MLNGLHNKLSLNIDKTHFMLFRRRRTNVILSTDLVIKGVVISRVEHTKFLGVFIDSTLTWSKHIQYMKGKIARGIGILCKGRKFFTDETLVTMFNSFVYPYLTYCIEVWGNTYTTYLNPITLLLKRAVRVIKGCKRQAHTTPLFQNLKIMNLAETYVYFVQLFMFKWNNCLLPTIFRDSFTRNSTIHEYNTRQHDLLHVPICNYDIRKRAVRFTGVRIMNYLHREIDYKCSIHTYKKHLKNFILSHDVTNLVAS